VFTTNTLITHVCFLSQDSVDDFRSKRVETTPDALPSVAEFQNKTYLNSNLLPVADLMSQKLETISKSVFRAFDQRDLVDKFAGIGIFGRALLLQTRLLIMLQVTLGMIVC
jgi:hypothetical protein